MVFLLSLRKIYMVRQNLSGFHQDSFHQNKSSKRGKEREREERDRQSKGIVVEIRILGKNLLIINFGGKFGIGPFLHLHVH